ncbi:MAG: hypothetical protein M3R15_12620, partial [Acidobacteriota bacterium]|nr:hypothetical protein [Acidobacteriota bacterium]
MHRFVEDVLARLPVIERRLKGWNSQKSIGMKMPTLVAPTEGSDRYYGSKHWQAEVRRWMVHHFESDGKAHKPHATARPVAS